MIRPERFELFYLGRCPIGFLLNIIHIGTLGLAKKSIEKFLLYTRMAAILNLFDPNLWGPHMLFFTFGPVVSKKKSFESVYERRTDDGGFPSCNVPGAFGSGELKKV